ncbi:putative GDSL lipase/esterase, SGNH hydrolase superfamily [Dioscorea sansibarensis]
MLGVPSPKPSLSISNKGDMVEEFLKGVNFTSGGAGVLDTTYSDYCMPPSQQIRLFNELVEKTIDKIGLGDTYEHMTSSYIIVNIGNNDINIATGTGIDPQEYATLLISTLQPHLQNIYNVGGHRFVTITTGAQGCLPLLRAVTETGGCNEEANKLAKAYNKKLASLIRTLQSESDSGALYHSYFDLFIAHERLNARREILGFTEGEVACCGTGTFNGSAPYAEPIPCVNIKNHIYWDNVHYTERFTGLLMKMAF